MDWSKVTPEVTEIQPYQNGKTTAKGRDRYGRKPAPKVEDKRVIAWDMEGMNLSGEGRPQHPVLFGCSAETDCALVGWKLKTWPMLEYIVDVGKRYPQSLHVGYGFRYDGNMLLQDLKEEHIIRAYKDGAVKVWGPDGRPWRIVWRPGKQFGVTKYWGEKKSQKTHVTIYDFSSFFGRAFIDAAEKILGDSLDAEDREVIAHGKKERGHQGWEDMPEVRQYWTAEIRIMERTFSKFRDVMCQAGFPLQQWYGPGALATHILNAYKMRPHMAGAQRPSGLMPDGVHEAVKRAFFGGRFELFKAGRTVGPVYVVDIGSAYPYALSMVPSLAEGTGEWKHVTNPDRVEKFGFYKVRYKAPNPRVDEIRPMPLPWRDQRGLITFPASVVGWYASPEARMLANDPNAVIEEGWYWEATSDERPWEFLREMYATRMRLGKDNLLSMPFKLGPNSMYGKMAQTVGWDQKNRLPPKSHALPIAAWITSYCRAMLYAAMRRAPGEIIAVETDSIITTARPETLGIHLGDGLGQWSVETYEEIMYLQSGLYHTKRGGEWTGTHSRGLHAREFPAEVAEAYLRGLLPGEDWEPLKIQTKPRFIGAGAARAKSGEFKDNHCVWESQTREIQIGSTGKRRHIVALCRACKEGKTPWEAPHQLVVLSRSDGRMLSHPRMLPWEAEHPPEVQEIRDRIALEADQSAR